MLTFKKSILVIKFTIKVGLRKVLRGLRDTNSILIVVSQTRDNLGPGFKTKTRSGGNALPFYSTCEIWTKVKGTLKKNVFNKDRKVGVRVGIKIEKNRITGRLSEVETMIYLSYGIDDIGSCIDYLVSENWWGKKKQRIVAKEFRITASREKVISYIEQKGLVRELQLITGRCWKKIQQACNSDRPKRYKEEE